MFRGINSLLRFRGDAGRTPIRIEYISDTTHQTRWIISGGSFQAASAAYAHFCLPFSPVKDRESSLALRVTWPDGAVQHVKKVSLRTRMLITRDTKAIR